jgi:hypothetical protein
MELENNGTSAIQPKQPLKFVIDDKHFETSDEYKTGAELKQLANIPLDAELYLSIKRPYEDELIENETKVNLARPEMEYFYVKRKLKFTINKISFEWHKQYITGEQIRKLGQIDPEHELYLKIEKPYEDELVNNETKIDLARPGVEHFVSKEKVVDFVIIVNGREKEWKEGKITFEQVVVLAFGKFENIVNKVYTVTYSRGAEPKPEGTMVKGSIVRVKNKMIFNVTATDKS